jgi:hypothetical protein
MQLFDHSWYVYAHGIQSLSTDSVVTAMPIEGTQHHSFIESMPLTDAVFAHFFLQKVREYSTPFFHHDSNIVIFESIGSKSPYHPPLISVSKLHANFMLAVCTYRFNLAFHMVN